MPPETPTPWSAKLVIARRSNGRRRPLRGARSGLRYVCADRDARLAAALIDSRLLAPPWRFASWAPASGSRSLPFAEAVADEGHQRVHRLALVGPVGLERDFRALA